MDIGNQFQRRLLPPCRVCGDKAAGFHYGVNTCEACKGFFHRSLTKHREYKCRANRNSGFCEYKPGKRKSCQFCRYQRCLEAGMSKGDSPSFEVSEEPLYHLPSTFTDLESIQSDATEYTGYRCHASSNVAETDEVSKNRFDWLTSGHNYSEPNVHIANFNSLWSRNTLTFERKKKQTAFMKNSRFYGNLVQTGARNSLRQEECVKEFNNSYSTDSKQPSNTLRFFIELSEDLQTDRRQKFDKVFTSGIKVPMNNTSFKMAKQLIQNDNRHYRSSSDFCQFRDTEYSSSEDCSGKSKMDCCQLSESNKKTQFFMDSTQAYDDRIQLSIVESKSVIDFSSDGSYQTSLNSFKSTQVSGDASQSGLYSLKTTRESGDANQISSYSFKTTRESGDANQISSHSFKTTREFCDANQISSHSFKTTRESGDAIQISSHSFKTTRESGDANQISSHSFKTTRESGDANQISSHCFKTTRESGDANQISSHSFKTTRESGDANQISSHSFKTTRESGDANQNSSYSFKTTRESGDANQISSHCFKTTRESGDANQISSHCFKTTRESGDANQISSHCFKTRRESDGSLLEAAFDLFPDVYLCLLDQPRGSPLYTRSDDFESVAFWEQSDSSVESAGSTDNSTSSPWKIFLTPEGNNCLEVHNEETVNADLYNYTETSSSNASQNLLDKVYERSSSEIIEGYSQDPDMYGERSSNERTTPVQVLLTSQVRPDSSTLEAKHIQSYNTKMEPTLPKQYCRAAENNQDCEDIHEMYRDKDTVIAALMASHKDNIEDYSKIRKENMLAEQKAHYEASLLKKQTFGELGFLQEQEYDDIYSITGIDVDNRRQLIHKYLSRMEKQVRGLVLFARSIPGFSSLDMNLQVDLIKLARPEFAILTMYPTVNLELGITLGLTGEHWACDYELGTIDVQLNIAEYMAFCDKLQKMAPTQEEEVLLKAMLIVSTDRDSSVSSPLAEVIRWQLCLCLLHSLEKNREQSSLFLARYILALTQSRTVAESVKNFLRQMKLRKYSSIEQNPLLWEMYSSILLDNTDDNNE